MQRNTSLGILIGVIVFLAAGLGYVVLTKTNINPVKPLDNLNREVFEPRQNQVVGNPLVFRGQGFDGTIFYHLRDSDDSVLVEGRVPLQKQYGTDAIDFGDFVKFNIQILYPVPKGKSGTFEIFDISEMDGSEINKITIPVRFQN